VHHLTLTIFIEINVLSTCGIISKLTIFNVLFNTFLCGRWSWRLIMCIFVHIIRVGFWRILLRRCYQILICVPSISYYFITLFIKLHILCVWNIVAEIAVFNSFFLFNTFLWCRNIVEFFVLVFWCYLYSCQCIRFITKTIVDTIELRLNFIVKFFMGSNNI